MGISLKDYDQQRSEFEKITEKAQDSSIPITPVRILDILYWTTKKWQTKEITKHHMKSLINRYSTHQNPKNPIVELQPEQDRVINMLSSKVFKEPPVPNCTTLTALLKRGLGKQLLQQHAMDPTSPKKGLGDM